MGGDKSRERGQVGINLRKVGEGRQIDFEAACVVQLGRQASVRERQLRSDAVADFRARQDVGLDKRFGSMEACKSNGKGP